MINFVRGNLAFKGESYIVVESAGLGFEINLPANSPFFLVGEGKEIKVFTHMSVKEDHMSLYGFDDYETLKMFRMLTGVNGVGGKGAMALIGSMPLLDLKSAVADEDAAMLTRANGIGKKTAQRIVLDLHDKMDVQISSSTDEANGFESIENISDNTNPKARIKAEAVEALCQLGFSRNEAVINIEKINIKNDNMTLESYVKEALKRL